MAIVHGLEVALVDAVDDGLDVLDGLDGGLCGLCVGGLEDHAALEHGSLLCQLDKAGVVAAVADGDEFDVLTFADTFFSSSIFASTAASSISVLMETANRLRETSVFS